jgi:hypothetical protein
MAERAIVSSLEQQIREVRAWTKKVTDRVPDGWLYRRVDWTDNTIGWHMGHLAQQQDQYAWHYFGAERVLDDEWDRLFGYGSEPQPAEAYPSPERLEQVFDRSLQHFLEQLAQVAEDEELLLRPPHPPAYVSPGWTVLNGVVNTIYHEGEHAAAIGTLIWSFERESSVV